MTQPIDDPDDLHELAFVAMEHALSSIEHGGPLIPFTLTEGAEGRKLARFAGGKLEVMVVMARQALAQDASPSRAVLAWDGYLTSDGKRVDALFVEAYERGAQGGILIAQPYKTTGLLKKRTHPTGQVGVIERNRPPLF